jgi:hypothetical protein
MKKTAFIQAFVLVVLLTAGWMVFINRLQDRSSRQVPQPLPAEAVQDDSTGNEPAGAAATGLTHTVAGSSGPMAEIPPGWSEWMDYLQGQPDPAAMRRALSELQELLQSMPPEEAAERILELLQGGFDLQTGLRFRIGPGGELTGAATLRANMLDWLARLQPETAAAVARSAVESVGTAMAPDEYVIHLRNFALGSPLEHPDTREFLARNFKEMLDREDWLLEPGPALAEGMDIAVFLEDVELVPRLAELSGPGRAVELRHAAALALERLFDTSPQAAARIIVESPAGGQMSPPGRAGLLARLDPAGPDSSGLLRDYLASPATTDGEAAWFLHSFPNLNQSFSNSLLSAQFPATTPAEIHDRLERALQAVQSWQGDPGLFRLGGVLTDTEARIRLQLAGFSAP